MLKRLFIVLSLSVTMVAELLVYRIATVPFVTVSEAAWIPEGEEVSFSSDRERERAIHAMALANRAPDRLTPLGEESHYPTLSTNGNRMAGSQ